MSTRVSTEVSTPQVRELRQPGTRARSQWARAVKVGEAEALDMSGAGP
jgi:hypothetical protein